MRAAASVALAASLAWLPALAGCPKPVPAAAPAADTKGRGNVPAETVPGEVKLKAANGWNGTYRNLLAVVHAPEDRLSYSELSEYGWKEAQPYKEYGPQPAGWWVYVSPYWFVWELRDGAHGEGGPGAVIPSDGKLPAAGAGVRAGLIDPATLPVPVMLRAAAGATGKYTNALAAIYDPEDAKSHSSYSDYGWRDTTSYKTYGQVPAGYWVYVEPYWVVWNLRDGHTGP